MNRINLAATAFAALLVVFQLAAPARSATRVWVSGSGDDVNGSNLICSITSPCATFQQAADVAGAGGEINVLTPGDYGPLFVRNSLSITNDGAGEASILAGPGSATQGTGIVVEAGAGDVVSLRGLVIDGQGVGGEGISIFGASAVHIQNCVIRNFEQAERGLGISLSSSGNTKLFVSDTIIYNNGSSNQLSGGILIDPGGNIEVVLDRVHLENNVIGLSVDGGGFSQAILRDSVVSGNASIGVLANASPDNGSTLLVVEHSSIANNAGSGIRAQGQHAVILLNGNSIKRNGTGISSLFGGQLISYGNNRNNNNIGAEGAPTSLYGRM